ncbi:hypothetical protein LDL77_19210 [Flagellimonas marinaquae]|uniref:hypothetical protein n=1 Tax=Flagellimonas aurea TaxID=2915619 RepID=UPI001CE190AB|nr:hypothetical protein LDL77_19210 [Allomuricauda aquimarina]
MKKTIRADYIFIIFTVLLLLVFFYKEFTIRKVECKGVYAIARVTNVEHVYNQGLFIIYEYEYNNKRYTGRKSVGSRKKAEKYLNKFFEITLLEDEPESSIININKEVEK